MNAKLPYVDKVELGELGDEAGAAYEYAISGLMFKRGDFVFKVFGGESGILPGDAFDGAGENNFGYVFDRMGEVVHVFIAGGIFDDSGPEVFHELVRGAAVEDGTGIVEHVGVVVM